MSDLPENWVEVSLPEISTIEMGQSPDSSTYNDQGKGLPFFQGKAEFGKLYPTVRKWCSQPKKIAEAGDILLSVRAPVGPTNLALEKCCIGRGLAAIRAKEHINQKYLLHYFRNIEPWLTQQGTGSTFTAISGGFIRELQIPLAPLPEQKRIAEKLDSLLARVDSCQTHLERVPQILKRFRQSVLKAACEGKLVSQDSSEGTADELLQTILVNRKQKLKKYKEPLQVDFGELDYVPSLPQNWTWVTLDQLTWSVKDGPHYSPQYAEDGIPFITGGNVRPDGVDFENARRISPELHAELSKRVKPEKGDILYTKGGTTGIARVNTYDIDFNVWVHVAVLKPCSPVDVFYLQHALNSEFCYNQAQKYTHGVGNQDLGLTRMIKIAIPLPPLEEQRRIVAQVEKLFAYAERLEVRYASASERVGRLSPSLLGKAFRGELVGQEAGDESAEELLQRIQAFRETGKEESQRIKTPRQKKSNAKKEASMLKKSEVKPDHLSSILKERGALTAESLWNASQLEIDEFYDQLKDEESSKLLREIRGDDENSPRLLEAL